MLRQGPLKNVAAKYLLLGKPDPFAEPFGGIDGEWEHADWVAYTHQRPSTATSPVTTAVTRAGWGKRSTR